jgi:hypothetical protein
MTWNITLYPYNILETGTVTVTGTPDAGYPESRLYDRATSLFWKDTITEAKNFNVDQGAAPIAVDFLAIEKHNFDAKDMQWQYSTDNFSGDVNDAVTDWNQDGNTAIIRTMGTEQTKQYWRATLASIIDPKCGEIFMSKGFSFDVDRRSPQGGGVSNVRWNRTTGGVERSTKFGQARRVRNYSLNLTAPQLASFIEAIDYLDDYSKPFYFKDHNDEYFMSRFTSDPMQGWDHESLTRIQLNLIEQL